MYFTGQLVYGASLRCQSRRSAHFPGRSLEICSTSLSPRPERHCKTHDQSGTPWAGCEEAHVPQRYSYPLVVPLQSGSHPTPRVPIPRLKHRPALSSRYDKEILGMRPPGIIPSICIQILKPRSASSSSATIYSALPVSFNQACSGPTPG
jgi:hypothetical protein